MIQRELRATSNKGKVEVENDSIFTCRYLHGVGNITGPNSIGIEKKNAIEGKTSFKITKNLTYRFCCLQ